MRLVLPLLPLEHGLVGLGCSHSIVIKLFKSVGMLEMKASGATSCKSVNCVT
jgi:hypothetical protein